MDALLTCRRFLELNEYWNQNLIWKFIEICIKESYYEFFNYCLFVNDELYDILKELEWKRKKKYFNFIYKVLQYDKHKNHSIILDEIIEKCIINNYFEKFYKFLELSEKYKFINYDLHLHLSAQYYRSDMARAIIQTGKVEYKEENEDFCPIYWCLFNKMEDILILIICEYKIRNFDYASSLNLTTRHLEPLISRGYINEEKIEQIKKEKNKKFIDCTYLDNTFEGL